MGIGGGGIRSSMVHCRAHLDPRGKAIEKQPPDFLLQNRDQPLVLREILLGIRRAGAQMILTYHAKQVAADIPCWDELG